MDTFQAIKAISGEIQKKDSDLYVFQPEDQKERFFIEAALISSAASIILSAFFKGLGSALEKKVEDWGEKVGAWMCEQLKALFRSKAQPVNKNELDNAITAAKNMVTGLDADQRGKVVSSVEKEMVRIFEESGMTEDRAIAIAASVGQSVISLIGGA